LTIGQPDKDSTTGEASTLISIKLIEHLRCNVVRYLVEFTNYAVSVSGSLYESRIAAEIVQDTAH
jgi:hypothetical protein